MSEPTPQQTDTPRTEDQACAATPEYLCAGALRHYDELSTKAHSWHSEIPRAICFWYFNKPELERTIAAQRTALLALSERIRRDGMQGVANELEEIVKL